VNYFVIVSLQRHEHSTVAPILSHSANLAFGPKSGFENKCRTRLGLQNEARLQLCCAG